MPPLRGTPFAVGGTESYLGVPIPAGDRSIGVFAIGSSEAYAFDEADARFLSTMASSLGVALENAQPRPRATPQRGGVPPPGRGAAAGDLRWIVRMTTSTSLYVEPQDEEIFGYPARSACMDEGFFASVIHPDDRAQVAAEVGESLTASQD